MKNISLIVFSISLLLSMWMWVVLFEINYILYFLISSLIVLLGLFFIFKKHHIFIVLIWLWFMVWSMWTSISNYHIIQKESIINNYNNKEIVVIWEIEKLYKKSENYNSYIIKTKSIDGVKIWNIKWLLYYSKTYALSKWDIIKTKVKLDKIENFDPMFNYIRYMESKNIYYSLFSSSLDIINTRQLWYLEKSTINLRSYIIDQINTLYSRDEANLLSGILIWYRLDTDGIIEKSFNKAWLTHFVSISGFHVTIVIIFLGFIFKFLPLYLRTIIISIWVIFFVILSWANIPAIRWWIMWIVGYMLIFFGRQKHNLTLLILIALWITLYEPLYLIYDVSFHLSFLAVVGIMYFYEFYSRVFRFIPNIISIRDSFCLTLSATTTTLPILLFSFGQISLLTPIANMLVWWVVPFAMLVGAMSIVWYIIHSYIWYAIGFVAYYILSYIIWVARYIWDIDGAIIISNLWIYSIYLELLYFMFIWYIIIYLNTKQKTST